MKCAISRVWLYKKMLLFLKMHTDISSVILYRTGFKTLLTLVLFFLIIFLYIYF